MAARKPKTARAPRLTERAIDAAMAAFVSAQPRWLPVARCGSAFRECLHLEGRDDVHVFVTGRDGGAVLYDAAIDMRVGIGPFLGASVPLEEAQDWALEQLELQVRHEAEAR